MRTEITHWAADEAERHKLGYTYAEGFQRIVLAGEYEQPTEAGAVETQAEEPHSPTD